MSMQESLYRLLVLLSVSSGRAQAPPTAPQPPPTWWTSQCCSQLKASGMFGRILPAPSPAVFGYGGVWLLDIVPKQSSGILQDTVTYTQQGGSAVLYRNATTQKWSIDYMHGTGSGPQFVAGTVRPCPAGNDFMAEPGLPCNQELGGCSGEFKCDSMNYGQCGEVDETVSAKQCRSIQWKIDADVQNQVSGWQRS